MNPSLAEPALIFSLILFGLGLIGLLVRRSVLFMLISVEIMLNAAGLAFLAGGHFHGQGDGQVMFIFILTTAAAEVSVGLALVMLVFRNRRTLNTDVFASPGEA